MKKRLMAPFPENIRLSFTDRSPPFTDFLFYLRSGYSIFDLSLKRLISQIGIKRHKDFPFSENETTGQALRSSFAKPGFSRVQPIDRFHQSNEKAKNHEKQYCKVPKKKTVPYRLFFVRT